jgi:hypothetical protein
VVPPVPIYWLDGNCYIAFPNMPEFLRAQLLQIRYDWMKGVHWPINVWYDAPQATSVLNALTTDKTHYGLSRDRF